MSRFQGAKNLAKISQEWATIAEVISAIAVVLTIGFLAFEMRANTNAIHEQTYQALTEQLNDYRAQLIDFDRFDAEAKLDKDGWDSLSYEEKQRIRLPSLNLFGIYESAYFANEREVIGDREWERFEIGICRNYRRIVKEGAWESEGFTSMNQILTPDFGDYIARTCN